MAKGYEPILTSSVSKTIMNHYLTKRQEFAHTVRDGDNYTTPRTLLALIRLCQAKVNF